MRLIDADRLKIVFEKNFVPGIAAMLERYVNMQPTIDDCESHLIAPYNDWKSCSKDGNPSIDGEYLVTARTERGYRYRRIAKYSAKSDRWDCLNIVIAWQELPEVYQDENI